MSYRLGLIGHPVAKSLSPVMHSAALAHCGLPGSYKLLDVPPARLREEVEAIRNNEYAGFNVTIPHKVSILDLCTDASKAVERVGAANTVTVRPDGSLFADNTDVFGFEFALFDALAIEDQSQVTACILGAGGAAKAAVAVALKCNFAQTFILARDKVKAEQLVAHFGSASLRAVSFGEPGVLNGINIVANTIPFGLTTEIDTKFISQLFEDCLMPNAFVFDMVYSRDKQDTQLVALAKNKQLPCCDGRGMLAAQAMQSFEIWTGRKVPFEVMIDALNKALVDAV